MTWHNCGNWKVRRHFPTSVVSCERPQIRRSIIIKLHRMQTRLLLNSQISIPSRLRLKKHCKSFISASKRADYELKNEFCNWIVFHELSVTFSPELNFLWLEIIKSWKLFASVLLQTSLERKPGTAIAMIRSQGPRRCLSKLCHRKFRKQD